MCNKLPILSTLMPDSKLDCYTTVYVFVNNLKAQYKYELLKFLCEKKLGKGQIKVLSDIEKIYQVTYTIYLGTESTQKSRLLEIRNEMYKGISDWINLQPNYAALKVA